MIQTPPEIGPQDVGVYLAYHFLQIRSPEDLMRLFKYSRRSVRRKLQKIRSVSYTSVHLYAATSGRS